MKMISHMVDEVCNNVGTRWFLPGEKIDKKDMDVHPQPSTVEERSHETPTIFSRW